MRLQERNELHDAIRGLHRLHNPHKYAGYAYDQAIPLAERMAVMFPGTFVPPGVGDAVFEVAAMAHEIPLKDLHAIITPSGYHQLAPNGKPAIWYEKRVGAHTFNGVYPYAVPAHDPTNKKIVIAQVGQLEAMPCLFVILPGLRAVQHIW
jgi:hypothetical protein